MDEGNEDVGLISFGVNKASSLGQKKQGVSGESTIFHKSLKVKLQKYEIIFIVT